MIYISERVNESHCTVVDTNLGLSNIYSDQEIINHYKNGQCVLGVCWNAEGFRCMPISFRRRAVIIDSRKALVKLRLSGTIEVEERYAASEHYYMIHLLNITNYIIDYASLYRDLGCTCYIATFRGNVSIISDYHYCKDLSILSLTHAKICFSCIGCGRDELAEFLESALRVVSFQTLTNITPNLVSTLKEAQVCLAEKYIHKISEGMNPASNLVLPGIKKALKLDYFEKIFYSPVKFSYVCSPVDTNLVLVGLQSIVGLVYNKECSDFTFLNCEPYFTKNFSSNLFYQLTLVNWFYSCYYLEDETDYIDKITYNIRRAFRGLEELKDAWVHSFSDQVYISIITRLEIPKDVVHK